MLVRKYLLVNLQTYISTQLLSELFRCGVVEISEPQRDQGVRQWEFRGKLNHPCSKHSSAGPLMPPSPIRAIPLAWQGPEGGCGAKELTAPLQTDVRQRQKDPGWHSCSETKTVTGFNLPSYCPFLRKGDAHPSVHVIRFTRL